MSQIDMVPIGIRWKLLITLLLLVFLILGAYAFQVFNQFSAIVTELETSKLSSDALAIAIAAADEIDPDQVRRLQANGIEGGTDWNDLYSQLGGIEEQYGDRTLSLTFFVYVPTTSAGEIEYLIDTWDNENRAHLGDRALLDAEDVRLAGLQNATVEQDVVFDENGEAFALAVAPIHAANGAVVGALGVEAGAARLVDVLARVGRSLSGTFLLAVPLSLAFAFLVSGGVLGPLSRLVDAARAIGDEERAYESSMLDTVMRRQDELGEVARRFHEMAESVKAREQRLRAQVSQMRIEIDEARARQQVEEITGDEYFKELAASAGRLRERAKTGPLTPSRMAKLPPREGEAAKGEQPASEPPPPPEASTASEAPEPPGDKKAD